MTAINLFRTANAACLLTDQAAMSGGKLVMIGSKVIPDQRLQMALAVNGNVTIRTRSIIKGWLAKRKDQAEAMGGMGELLAMVRADAETGTEPTPPKLFIALWRPGLNKPETYFVDTAITCVSRCESPPSEAMLPLDPTRPWLIERIEDQRRQADNIGAAAELTTVTATGITSEIIHRWPDRLGEPITP